MRFAGKAKSEKPGNQTGVKRKLGSDISSAKKPKGIPYNEVNGSSLQSLACVCVCVCGLPVPHSMELLFIMQL